MSKANQPIGIFDSGIGGLTVANAIQQVLPAESLIYFGDTAHLPYGEKSPQAIRSYSLKIADFLLEKKCTAIVRLFYCLRGSARARCRKGGGNRCD
jgi:glutamate racemase